MANFVSNLRSSLSANTPLADKANLGKATLIPKENNFNDRLRTAKAQDEKQLSENRAAKEYAKQESKNVAAINGMLYTYPQLSHDTTKRLNREFPVLKEMVINFGKEPEPSKREDLIKEFLSNTGNDLSKTTAGIITGLLDANEMLKYKNESGNEEWLNETEYNVADYYDKMIKNIENKYHLNKIGRIL